jgi:outer membrane protein assembly factor BamD
MKRLFAGLALALVVGCGGGSDPEVAPMPVASTPQVVDSIWALGRSQFSGGHFGEAAQQFERVLLELRPGDPRIPAGRFYLGEARFGMGQNFEAAREFRRVADESPNDALAPRALLRAGESFADLWDRPELDPSYGETARATFTELQNRYPGTPAAETAKIRLGELDEMFAEKAYLTGAFYHRIKAYDSAILYFKDLVATYPRTRAAPKALVKLVEEYRLLRYEEDAAETCDYLRRFHTDVVGLQEICPAPTTS